MSNDCLQSGHKTKRAGALLSSLSHTRENVSVCEVRAVHCGVHTHRRLQGNRCCLYAKALKKTTLIRAQCASQFEKDQQVDDLHQVVEEDVWFRRRSPNPASGGVDRPRTGFVERIGLDVVELVGSEELNYKRAHYSCHPVDDHHVVEDVDHVSGDGHNTLPVFGSTDHATSCSPTARSVAESLCCWNCCPWRCRTWRSGRMVGLN